MKEFEEFYKEELNKKIREKKMNRSYSTASFMSGFSLFNKS